MKVCVDTNECEQVRHSPPSSHAPLHINIYTCNAPARARRGTRRGPSVHDKIYIHACKTKTIVGVHAHQSRTYLDGHGVEEGEVPPEPPRDVSLAHPG